MMPYFVYILRTDRNTLYVGQTNNLEKRLKTHKDHKGSKYLMSFTSFELVHREEYATKSEALKREYEIKHWPKVKKERLISGLE